MRVKTWRGKREVRIRKGENRRKQRERKGGATGDGDAGREEYKEK